eukprot:358262-Chlamydomonas_euryale.AAC.18
MSGIGVGEARTGGVHGPPMGGMRVVKMGMGGVHGASHGWGWRGAGGHEDVWGCIESPVCVGR